MKKEIEVILKSAAYRFDINEFDKDFLKIVNSFGYKEIDSIESRTDQRIINFIKQNMNEEDERYYSSNSNEFFYISKVDTSKAWMIEEFELDDWTVEEGDEGECILYFKLKNKELNFYVDEDFEDL